MPPPRIAPPHWLSPWMPGKNKSLASWLGIWRWVLSGMQAFLTKPTSKPCADFRSRIIFTGPPLEVSAAEGAGLSLSGASRIIIPERKSAQETAAVLRPYRNTAAVDEPWSEGFIMWGDPSGWASAGRAMWGGAIRGEGGPVGRGDP